MTNLSDILVEYLKIRGGLICESVSVDDVVDAINNKYQVIITYDDEKYHKVGKRLIEPYVYGLSRAGNNVFRAYQYNGDTQRGVPKWKLFRLDRVLSWETTSRHFNVEPRDNGWPAEAYNENGDGSMSVVLTQVKLDDYDNELYSPSGKLYNIRRNLDNLRKSEPVNIFKNKENDKDGNAKVNGSTVKSEPIKTDVINTIQNQNDTDFQKMLKRNLEITKKEKEKRNFSLSNNNNNNNNNSPIPIDTEIDSSPVDISNVYQQVADEPINKIDNGNEITDIQKDVKQVDANKQFDDMLRRNLDLTRRNKAKRGYDMLGNKIKK